jgi:hypothetical protein
MKWHLRAPVVYDAELPMARITIVIRWKQGGPQPNAQTRGKYRETVVWHGKSVFLNLTSPLARHGFRVLFSRERTGRKGAHRGTGKGSALIDGKKATESAGRRSAVAHAKSRARPHHEPSYRHSSVHIMAAHCGQCCTSCPRDTTASKVQASKRGRSSSAYSSRDGLSGSAATWRGGGVAAG